MSQWGLEDENITRGGVFADLNRDGILDLIRSSMLGPTEVFWGQESLGDWLEIELYDDSMNTFGIGARIDIHAVDGTVWTRWIVAGDSFASSGPPRAHFGFGVGKELDYIHVHWADGGQSLFHAPDVNMRIQMKR